MRRVELEALIDRVRRPHNRRMVALLGLMLVVFVGGMCFMPRRRSLPQRELWMLVVVGLDVVIVSAGMTPRAPGDQGRLLSTRCVVSAVREARGVRTAMAGYRPWNDHAGDPCVLGTAVVAPCQTRSGPFEAGVAVEPAIAAAVTLDCARVHAAERHYRWAPRK